MGSGILSVITSGANGSSISQLQPNVAVTGAIYFTYICIYRIIEYRSISGSIAYITTYLQKSDN
jgi:hypothetical protein